MTTLSRKQIKNASSDKIPILKWCFPKNSHRRLPKLQFPKWQLPKCTTSQAASSQMLGCLLRRRRMHWGQSTRTGWARGPSAEGITGQGASAAVRADLGSCRFGNCIFLRLPLGNISFGKFPLGKKTTKHLLSKVYDIKDRQFMASSVQFFCPKRMNISSTSGISSRDDKSRDLLLESSIFFFIRSSSFSYSALSRAL